MEIYARQGDQVIEAKGITGELTEHTDLVIAGSQTSAHTLRGKCEARREGTRLFVRLSADSVITHADRHRDTPIVAGTYEIRPLRERGGNGDRAVED